MSTYYEDDAVTLHHGDALDVLRTLDSGSVDCCVTSPPYYGLRDYGVDPTVWPEVTYAPVMGYPAITVPAMTCGLGAEPDPIAFVGHLRLLFAEVRRVLADDGTLWLNLGDSYAGGGGSGPSSASSTLWGNGHRGGNPKLKASPTVKRPAAKGPAKSLLGIPWRTNLTLVEEGWIHRQEVIWSKRSCMPEAVTDRPSRSHEQVFLLTKRPRYWYDADAIREESDPEQVAHNERYAKVYAAQADRASTTGQPGNVNSAGIHARPGKPGRNARSVWHISSTPFPGAHFATMPLTLAEMCVTAGCKPGGTVLDPFSGSGTTGLAAAKHGRRYVGIDLNREYLAKSLETRLRQTALVDGGAA